VAKNLLTDYTVVVDGEEYEIDVSYSYQQKVDGRGIVCQIEQVTQTKTQLDIDPEMFQNKLPNDLMAEIETACDEYQEAREGMDWR
jgi:hypothetical protein